MDSMLRGATATPTSLLQALPHASGGIHYGCFLFLCCEFQKGERVKEL
jgi:hypothetical protein